MAAARVPTPTGSRPGSPGPHGEAGRLEEALADLTAALSLEPSNAQVLTVRGEVHRRSGHYDEAVVDLTAALELEPSNAWVLAHRGATHRQAGRYGEAVADLTAALRLGPSLTWVLAHRGVTHRQAGHYLLAREDFEQAAALRPRDPGLMFEMLLLDTVTSGFAAHAKRWTRLLGAPVTASKDNGTRFFALFRVLLLEPRTGEADVIDGFLSGSPDHDAITDLVLYLTELSRGSSESATRAARSLHLLRERRRP